MVRQLHWEKEKTNAPRRYGGASLCVQHQAQLRCQRVSALCGGVQHWRSDIGASVTHLKQPASEHLAAQQRWLRQRRPRQRHAWRVAAAEKGSGVRRRTVPHAHI
jgi:hypothetical protein